jgi:DNA primase
LQDTFVGFINQFLKQRIEELQAKVAQEGLSSEETQELMMLIREVQIEKRNESGA